jgi:hypothetical protein
MRSRLTGCFLRSQFCLFLSCLALASSIQFASAVSFAGYTNIPTGSWPEAVSIADLNGDARKDVVLSTSSYSSTNDNSILIFYQNNLGALNAPVRYAAGSAAVSIAIADFNGDGLKDIAVGKKTAGIRVFWQAQQGTFSNFTDFATANANWICTGDFNNDGRSDIAGIGWSSSQVDVFTQNNGTLILSGSYPASYSGYNDIKAGDVNGDGLSDIVVMNGQLYAVPNVSVLYQTNGGFSPAIICDLGGSELTAGVGIGDINSDGLSDIVVCYGGNRPTSFLGWFNQTPAGTFINGTPLPSYDIPEGITVADLDLDGRADVVTLHGGWNRAGVYPQNSSGSLNSEILFTIPYASHYNPHGLAVGDINSDGMPDIVIADYNNGLVILRNTSPPPPFRISQIKCKPGSPAIITAPYPGPHGSSLVQASDNLINWVTLGTMLDPTWTDTGAASASKRFYRLLAQ